MAKWKTFHYKERKKGGAIAQWIRLCLPSCGRGFESHAHHLCFYSQKLFCICRFIEKKDENKQIEAGLGPYFEKTNERTLTMKAFWIKSIILSHRSARDIPNEFRLTSGKKLAVFVVYKSVPNLASFCFYFRPFLNAMTNMVQNLTLNGWGADGVIRTRTRDHRKRRRIHWASVWVECFMSIGGIWQK